MEKLEIRVWTESSDLVYAGTSYQEAQTAMAEAIREHVQADGCDGCGVLTAPESHGFHVQVCDGERDVTGDPTYFLEV